MKKTLSLLSLLLFINFISFAQTKVNNLLTENLINPVGLDAAMPRFSWQLQSDERNVMQSAYEIRVSQHAHSASGKPYWSSGKVTNDSSVHVCYKGDPLLSGKRYDWQVRVWDHTGKPSDWSAPAFFQTAFLNPGDFKAKWIVADFKEDSSRPSPVFHKQFSASKKIESATAYITSHGMYEAKINGKRVGDAYLTPGWTSYNKRLQYQVYDVTSLLNEGANAVGVTLGNGWYRGYLAWAGNKDSYGSDVALLFQLDITYTNGTSESIVSDGSWKSAKGAIVNAEIYDGESYDARKEKPGWTLATFNGKDWAGVVEKNFSKSVLLASCSEPVKKHETFKPARIFTTPAGEKVIDFGQNLVGWVTIKASGKSGDKIKISHAEVLDKKGNLYTDNLRAAKAKATYILKGGGEETFEPHFTFYGFRYIRIDNYPGNITADNFTAVTLYSDMRPTGSFTSSSPLINQLQHNIQWGQKGNFLDVPTDCPQRDERLGWTGDAQVFSRTASYNMNVNNFFAKWLKDVAADQAESGSVPFVVPNVLGAGAGGSAGWADVATIAPWNMYLAYGDKRILENQYSSMKNWVEYMHGKSNNDLWNTGFHFGDWLFYRPDDDNDGRSAVTDKYLIAQCFYAHSTQLLINAAEVLGKTEDEEVYKALLKKVKDAFMNEYVTKSGRLVSGSQTAYVLALQFDMLPEGQRAGAAERLARNVADYDNHLTTGFLGTPYLCHVLSRFGYTGVAYKLLLQETYPSWLYPVKMGATTIWERWDGEKPDSTFQTPGMNSFNHYAYGAIGDWMYRVVAGLDTDESGPGYKHITIKPHIGAGLTNAAADLQTYYGNVSSSWHADSSSVSFNVQVPPNTTADIYLPAENAKAVMESGKPLASVAGLKVKEVKDGNVVMNVGSGNYVFTVGNKQ